MKSLYDKMVTSEDGKIGLDSISLLVEAILLDGLIVDHSLLGVQQPIRQTNPNDFLKRSILDEMR